MKPFTSRLCCNSGINYGTPVKHTSQKYGKDNEGHYHYKDEQGKPTARFSTTPVKNVGHGMKAITDSNATAEEKKAHMMYHQKQRMMKTKEQK